MKAMIAFALSNSTRAMACCVTAVALLSACTTAPQTKRQPFNAQPIGNARTNTPPLFQPLKISPTYQAQSDDPNKWSLQYQQWYQANNLHYSDSYVYFLKAQRKTVPPLDQLMRSALSYANCNSEPYSLPYPEIWQNMLPTIDLLNELEQDGILYQFEITSGYRNASLNSCVGGAKASKHMFNAALDIRFVGEQNSAYGQYITKQKLCDFWRNQGERYRMGLGVYRSGIIHIDTQGWRTWGTDYTSRTSMCIKPAYGQPQDLAQATAIDVGIEPHVH